MPSGPSSGSPSTTHFAMVSSPEDSNSRPFFRRFTSKKMPKSPTQSHLSSEIDSAVPGSSSVEAEKVEDSGVSTSGIAKAKLSALDKLKRLGSRPGKAKKTGEKTELLEFPPTEWGINQSSGLAGTKNATEEGKESIDLEEVVVSGAAQTAAIPLPPTPAAELNTPSGALTSGKEDAGEVATDAEERPEPMSLAKRIQLLLSVLTSSGASTPASQTPTAVPLSADSPPAPTVSATNQASANPDLSAPPPTTGGLVTDKRLVSLLSSATVMNGSLAKGKESVWAILDRLKLSPARSSSFLNADSSKGKGKGKERADERENDGAEDVMLYAPLVPQPDSQVEVAESEIITLNGDADDGQIGEGAGQSDSDDLKNIKGKEKMEKKVKERVIWVPSTTKISLQVAWWGYRIYLPPPVLHVLNNKSLEAAKRAAIITTALKWLLDHLPTSLLPPQFRPAAMLLKQLIPLLGYIGTFIAWSWTTIKMFDKGHGVILSATWLLPVALIPGTWEESEVPRPPAVPSDHPDYQSTSPTSPGQSARS